MVHRASLWWVLLPVLLLLFATRQTGLGSPQDERGYPPGPPGAHFIQAGSPTPEPESPLAPTATRARRTTTPTVPALPTQHNPGLIVGGILVVAIILLGVLRFVRAGKG